MKIFFAKDRSGAGISIRAAVNALLNWRKAERAQTAARKKNVPQITPGWDYRPRQAIRGHPAVDCASAETSDVLNPELLAINDVWSNGAFYEWTDHTFINSSHDIRGARDESASENPDTVCAARTDDEAAVSTYD